MDQHPLDSRSSDAGHIPDAGDSEASNVEGSVLQELQGLRGEIANMRAELAELTSKRRSWAMFRPSLRTLFILTALIACWFSWMGYEIRRSRRIDDAAKELARLGASISTKPSERLFVSLLPGNPASPPIAVRAMMGRELFVEPATMNLVRQRLQPLDASEQDKLFEMLGKFDSLTSLRLDSKIVSPEHMSSIFKMKDLKSLTLRNTRLYRGAMPGLAELPLHSLDVSHTLFDDEAVKSLAGSQDLRVLKMDRTAITESALLTLASLRDLRELHIRRCNISLKAVQEFSKQMPNCFIEYEPLIFDAQGRVSSRVSYRQRQQFGTRSRGSYNYVPTPYGVWGGIGRF